MFNKVDENMKTIVKLELLVTLCGYILRSEVLYSLLQE